jgi:hypothetical protein
MPKWYYTKSDRTYGPWAIEGIKELVAAGSLADEDLIWPDGADPKTAKAVREVLAACQRATPIGATGLPDWLRDIAETQARGPTPPPKTNGQTPDWIKDVQEAEQSAVSKPSASSDIEHWSLDFQAPPVRTSNVGSTISDYHHVAQDAVEGALTPKQKRRRALLIGLLTGVPFWIFVIGYLIHLYVNRQVQ